jgi:tetratricopeptide (TPR) repeat protein
MASHGKSCGHSLETGHRARIICVVSLLIMEWALTSAQQIRAQAPVKQLYQEAQAARARGDLATAAQKYREVIRRDPGLASAYQNLGIVYLSQKSYQDAITVLEKAVRLNPRLAGAYVILGLAHYELSQSDKAVMAFQDAHRLDPNDTNAFFFLGKAQMQLGNYWDAASIFEKLSQSRPKDPDVLYNLSLAHLKLFLETSDRLNAIAPHSFQFSLLEAQDAEGHANDAAATQYYQEALSSKPYAVGIHYGLGNAYARQGKFDEAAQEFQRELQTNPNDFLALWKLGEITMHADPAGAVPYLRQAVNLNPEFPQAVLAYGRALLRTGETEKAIEQFHKVVKLSPEEDTVHYLLANACRKLGRQAEAEAEMGKFQQLARRKSAQRDSMAQDLVRTDRQGTGESLDLDAGFSRSRQPIHP